MALSVGLPGYRLGAGPLFVTGEPRREYYFQFLLRPPAKVSGSVWTQLLFSDLALLYVSGLAEKVTLPPHKFSLGQVNLGTLQVPFPQRFEISPLSVVYMEDELGTVGVFHRVWMENIRGYDGGGITFEELGKVCASAIYSPSKKIPLPVFSPEIPIITGAETFPRIFPVQIDRDPANKAGNNFSKVTVTYARVPNIVIPDDVYFWWGRGVVRVSGTRE